MANAENDDPDGLKVSLVVPKPNHNNSFEIRMPRRFHLHYVIEHNDDSSSNGYQVTCPI